jgi:peptidoglycan glycosyltransferase
LALASVPAFDPNGLREEFSSLRADQSSPLLNRAVNGLYPPGSTFKIFTASAALDSQTVTMQSTFYDPGYYRIGNFTLHDDEGEATGTQDLTGAFALSSNVDFGQIALNMGTDTFYRYLDRWGIGSSLDFQIPASRDRVPPKASIVPGELAQMGFGQGALLMTPLQMALVAATIADKGVEPKPYLVQKIVAPDGSTVTKTAPQTLGQVIKPTTAAELNQMMQLVVQGGTAANIFPAGLRVAGKTGTAELGLGTVYDAWFVCFAPANNPRYVVSVVVEKQPNGFGASVSAPIARTILEKLLGG